MITHCVYRVMDQEGEDVAAYHLIRVDGAWQSVTEIPEPNCYLDMKNGNMIGLVTTYTTEELGAVLDEFISEIREALPDVEVGRKVIGIDMQ